VVAAHHDGGREVDEVPVVDPVDAASVQLVELTSALVGGPLATGLLVHDRQRTGAHLVDVAVEQVLDLARCHLDEVLREGEHVTHPHPHEHIALAVLPGPRLEVALDLVPLGIRPVGLQLFDEPGRGQLSRHRDPFRSGGRCRSRRRSKLGRDPRHPVTAVR
jgi:hypothetical protein